MAISTTCPSCQAKLKVPEQMENQKGKCPKCQKMFVITKCDAGNSGEAKTNIKVNEEPFIVPVEKKTPPLKPDLDTEVIEPRIKESEVNPRVIQTNVIVNQAVAPTNSLGISSLVVAIMSYFMCWVPGIGVIISGLAVLLGLGGLFMALKRKGTGVGYAIAGLVLAAVSLVITFCWSSAVFQTADKLVKANDGGNANIAVPGNKVGAAPVGRPINDLQNDLVNASKEPALFQGIEVKMKSVNIDYVTGVDIREFTSNEKHLKIVLYISNLNLNKKIDYDGWGRNRLGVGKGTPSLTDNFGNMYKLVNFGLGSRIEGQIKSEALYPNKPISDLIVFEKPLDTLEYLVLDLPAGNLGLEGRIQFKIPKEMINLEIKKAQEDLAKANKDALEQREKRKIEMEEANAKEMLAKKQAEVEAEKAKQKAIAAMEEKEKKAKADIAADEADRKKKFDEKGLTYYPLPRTVYEGKTADQWNQIAVNSGVDPSQLGQPGRPAGPGALRPGGFNSGRVVDKREVFQEAISALIALKEEGTPFLLEALQKQTTTQGRAFYLQAINGELVHPNDVPGIMGALASNKNQIQTRMIALRILAKNPGSKKHYQKIREMIADLFPNNNVKVEVNNLLKAMEK